MRTGVVLDKDGGALAKMLPFFRLGVGGPVAGGRQYMPWIHADDIVGLYLAALDGDALGRADQRLARPSRSPTATSRARSAARCTGPPSRRSPASRCALLYGDMAEIVTTGQRAVPMRALGRGYAFRHTDLEQALRDAVVELGIGSRA